MIPRRRIDKVTITLESEQPDHEADSVKVVTTYVFTDPEQIERLRKSTGTIGDIFRDEEQDW